MFYWVKYLYFLLFNETKIHMVNFNEEEISRKNKVIDSAIITLKKEFVGIDKQIEEIMDNVRSWFVFPQLQNRPLVVNLFGMSGTGKTSLVKRIATLLDIEKDLVYFNFASISESSSWEIEQQIEDELENENSQRMFVYDEFQYANTLNPINGEESEKKSGLKPFWELLDSGILHKRSEFWVARTPYRILEYMFKINTKCKMIIQDGVWINAEECLTNFMPYDINKFNEVFDWGYNGVPSNKPNVEEDNEKHFFIRKEYIERLISLYQKSKCTVLDEIELYHKIEKMDCDEIIMFVSEVYDSARKGYDLKFNDSIIFVIANLDEAYRCSFDVNPDMSPDQFRKITEQISVVDIKESLMKRFRNEQIARLGNIHVIYPSFSIDNFVKIINMSLDSYAKDVKKLTGYNIGFDDLLRQIVYDEGVFPTHGTRPIFSTVQELVKSRLPDIMMSITKDDLVNKVTDIVLSFDNDKDCVVAKVLDKKHNTLGVYEYSVKLRLKHLRISKDNDDMQALCALHESGHFVMYAKLFGRIPEKLVSKTADTNSSGFMMEDVDKAKKITSKQDYLNQLCVLLGGYVAEKKIFGDKNRTAGASSDLYKATQLASTIIRRYGMGNYGYLTTAIMPNDDPYGFLIYERENSNINHDIKSLFEYCLKIVEDTFEEKEWKKMLKESATYLCDHSQMPKEKMQEIYDNVSDSVKLTQRDNDYYRNMVLNM